MTAHPAQPTPLPLLPTHLLRRYHCAEPNDTRFRSSARLRQSLWREEHGYACGRYVHPDGRTCRLGSMVSNRVGQRGINLVDPTLLPLVQYEIAYREVGALIYVERLWNNLLASQALTFNLFGPLKQNLALATAVMRRLIPDCRRSHGRRLRTLARPRPPWVHRRSHRFRRPAPLPHTAGPQRLCRHRGQVLRSTGRHRLTRPAPLRRAVAGRRRLPRSGRALAPLRPDRTAVAGAVAGHSHA